MSRPPPPSEKKDAGPTPLIPLDIIDAPTQRLYLVAALVLVQAYKLSHFLSPASNVSTGEPNRTLWKWILIDILALQVIKRLRIPRLTWGWKARWFAGFLLVGLDYLLFGRWTFTATMFLPSSIKSLLTHYYSTAERSVRLSKVVGNKGSHLGGQYTVHILAVSTAILNPLSSTYCRFASSKTSEPTLIPLLLNNTSPSKLTYSLTSLNDPSSSREITIPASQLIKPRKHHLPHHHHQQHSIQDASQEDDDLALAAQWSLVPSNPKQRTEKNKNLHHPLPPSSPSSSSGSSLLSSSANSANENPLDLSDPFSTLSSTQSLYYLPITTPGHIELVSIIDTDGHPIRIRRKRSSSTASTSPSSYESTLITHCPQAGFNLEGQSKVEHRCLVDTSSFVEEQSVSLGLSVKGNEPLKINWYSRQGDSKTGFKRVETLEGIVGPDGEENEVVKVPYNVSLSSPGQTHYFIDKVTDSYGNEVIYSGGGAPLLEGTEPSRSVVVHRLPEIMFIGECSRGEEVQLLHGKKKRLQMRLSGLQDEERYQGQVGLRFTPISSTEDGGRREKGWTRRIEAKGRNVEVEVEEQGRYEIVDVKSDYCQGAVLVPNACTLILQPLPTLSTTFTPLHDLCSAPTGLLTTLHLTGVAPFTVSYTLTRLSGARPSTSHHTHRLSHSRDELKLEPGPGEWEVRFTQIEDRYYKKLPLKGLKGEYSTRIKVEEVAEARWREKEKTVHSCEGGTIGVEVDLKGSAPWTLEYSVVGQKPRLIEGIQKSPHYVEVDIPNLVSQQGGQFALSLESVLDSHGCRRPLTSPDLVVDVRRTKPTARFHGAEGKREVVIREGDEARVPVRLTGEGPWTITYSAPTSSQPVSFTAHQPNVDLLIPSAPAGTYKLLSVRDKFCPGDVVETEWNVGILEKPKVGLSEKSGKKKGGVIKREGVCQNKVDSVELTFQGKAPFKATYTLSKGSHSDSRVHTLQAIQPRASLTLFTAEPGHHAYEITGVSDSLYTSTSSSGLVNPIKLEQDVWALPEAHFAHGAKHGFCVHDELASRSSDDLVLELSGQAPFSVELEVKEEGKRGTKKFTVPEIKSHRWPVSLPYKLHTPNPHSIAVRRVVDAHGCESLFDSAPSSASSSALVPSSKLKRSNFALLSVSETATISPVSPQIDHCVGDFLDFVVQGSPPFTVKYEFEGKKHSVPLKGSQFQRLATEEGTFRVLSVGRGEDQCRSNSVDLVKRVHPIPSAKVSTGESIVVDIREGDQTEIVFSFTGTPPFSFTYSRRAPQDRSKDKKVLETHTVTGIEENSYSILTSQEGTYSVSYIADKYCSYPPASKSGAVVRS